MAHRRPLAFALCAAVLVAGAHGLGCMRMICAGNEENAIRDCPDKDNTCGTFNGQRHGGRVVPGVDVVCEAGAKVHAPFDGVLYYWRPLGGVRDKDCLDKGVRLEGRGQWQGYIAQVAYVEPYSYGKVKRGQEIGVAVALACHSERNTDFTNYIQMRLYRKGKLIDPTYHLNQCMCTGQICESNNKNELVGAPFKLDQRYNGVKGWELRCDPMRDTHDKDGNMIDPADVIPRPALVRSPIAGRYIGRIRLRHSPAGYEGCDNDGIVIEGSGRWQGYTVRIYNAKLADELTTGDRAVEQGDDVGERLDCGGSTPNSVTVEFLKEGRHVDMSDNISADSCGAPN